MAKMVNFDLSGADEEVWDQSEGNLAEAPKRGIYQAKVREITPGFSKDDDGKPDKKRPRLEVVLEVIGDVNGDEDALSDMGYDGNSCLGAWIWDYVSFSKASEWKQAEFTKAIGEGSKKKLKGRFDAEKHEGKTLVKIRVKADKNLEGDYRAKVGGMWPWSAGDPDDTDDIDDELDGEGIDTDDLTLGQVQGMKVAELREVAEELELDGSLKKTALRDSIIEELELEDEDDDENDDFDDDDEEENEGPSADDVREMNPAELKSLAKDNGISLKGMKKSEAVDHLIDELGLDEDVPF